MGWDTFGLPAENAEIANNTHPSDWKYSNVDKMRDQLKNVGLSHYWNREVSSCSPDYYEHEHKSFLSFIERDTECQKESSVNWDPVDDTALANRHVVDGRGCRSGTLVEKYYLKP